MPAIEMSAMDLAALLCSRVCHDVISPVGAIQNGLEILADEKDAGMREVALDLINKSAHQAGARLKFARIAYGASGSAGASLDMGDAEQAARDFIGDEKVQLSWAAPRVLLPKNKIKLLLNLLVVATHAVPRGGSIDIKADVDGETCHFAIVAKGSHARIPPHVMDLINGDNEQGSVDAHGVQAYYTGLIAKAAAMRVSMDIEGDVVTIKAVSTASAA